MTIESMLFVAYIGVIMPLLIVRRSHTRQGSQGPLPSRVSIYVGTGVLQAIYLALAIPVARIEGIPLFTPLVLTSYGILVGLGWIVVKLVLVDAVSIWWPRSNPQLLLRMAPELQPRSLASFALLCATTGVVEEVTFRVLLPGLLLGWGIAPVTVWIVSSLVFGLGHASQGVRGCVLAGLLGGVNLLLFWHLGSIWPLVLSHALYDFVSGLRIALGARMAPSLSQTQQATR
jgi:hypothetical protein